MRSANTLLTLTLICATHPEKLQRAQAELDAVIGQDRLPELADIQNLPYVQAFIKEVIRWRPTAPGGSPHLTTCDELYNGMLIPKDSYIVGNTWCATCCSSALPSAMLTSALTWPFLHTRLHSLTLTLALARRGILMDHDFFEDPEDFIPERFVRHEHGLKKGVTADYWRNTYGFGAGRRICIGMHFAENELNIISEWEAVPLL